MTTDSRVRKGTLKFSATGPGAGDDFAVQITSCAVVPSTNSEEPQEVLSGDFVGGGATNSDRLNFSLISDFAEVNGLVAFSWRNRNQSVNFEFTPTGDPAGKWAGKVTAEALQVGGEVGKQLSVDGSWLISAVTPPAGYAAATTSKANAAPGTVYPAEATITASDSANAAKLAGLGYVAKPATAWTAGQKITVGTFDFNWSGTAWAAGAKA